MSKIDIRAIYIAYKKGENIDNEKEAFTEPHIIYASVSEPISYENVDDIGRIPEYDRTLVLNTGYKNEFLREDSRIWIDTVPNSTADNFDYVIARVGDIVHGQLKIYCNAIAPNTQFLYYLGDDGNIYRVKVFYKDLVAIVPKNMYFPVDENTAVWYIKPAGTEETEAKITFVEKVPHNKTYSYKFEEA